MDILSFVVSWSPVLLLTVLAVFLGRTALELSIYGFLFSAFLAVSFFRTPIEVVLLASLDGLLTTLPLLLVILAGTLLSSLLILSGSIARIVEWLGQCVGDSFRRNLLITFGLGNFMESSGVIAEPVVAPMLKESGVSSTGSAALSIVGYAGMMTLELGGIIVTVLALITALPSEELGVASAWLSIPATVVMAMCAMFFLPRPERGWTVLSVLWVIFIGLTLGLSALATVYMLGVPMSGVVAGFVVILIFILRGSGKFQVHPEVIIDLAPFIFMLICMLAVNTVPYLYKLTYEQLVMKISVIPVHSIIYRPFFSAYTYLFLAFFLSVLLLRTSAELFTRIVRNGLSKGWRAFASMGLFGAMGQIVSYTGYDPQFSSFEASNNIPAIISKGLILYSGELYPMFVPVLGWVGTFLTGYGVASLMLFGQLQIQAAGMLNVSAVWLAAALAVGSSIGSISSPFKIALSTPMVDAIGKEGEILRWTIPLGIVASLLVGLALYFML